MTMGLRRQVLLLPSEFATSLSDEDLSGALAHEFAHMRRRDFAKNLVYEVLSLPIAYHPLLWLTRARLAESREMVCDAMAARAAPWPNPGSMTYARSLLRLASLLLGTAPTRKFQAIGIFDANGFERRIMSLTRKPVELRAAQRWAIHAMCVAMAIGTCASAMALRMEVPAALIQSGNETAPAGRSIPVQGGVMAANILTRVAPVYPPSAKSAGVQGSVVLTARIGRDGIIQHLQVVSGPAELQKSALDAVRQWTYKPYLLNGDPVAVSTTVTVNYSLQ